jgi:hypothetical protein
MSAGAFVITKYQASYATQIHPIKVQPETLAMTIGTVTNDPPTGNVSSPISAQVSGSRKKLGLHARTIAVRFTGTPPTGYSNRGTIRVPLLTQAIAAVAVKGAAGLYLGVAIVVAGDISLERAR